MERRNTLFLGIIVGFILFSPLNILAEKTEELTLISERIMKLEVKVEKLEIKVEEGFKAVNQRIDDVNRRIDDLKGLTYVILAGIIALIGFVLWDRKTALAPAVRKATELEEEEEKIKKALKEYALKEPELATALRRVGLM